MQARLKTPIKEEDVRKLNVRDIVYLDGIIYTGRDEVHIHALEQAEHGEKPPVDFKGMALYHCGPIMKKVGEEWKLVAAGPTTSSRMNSLEPKFIEKFRPSAIIGKGGMSQPTIDAMSKFGAVYLAITGGAAVLAAKGITKVHGVHWFEFGMPEAIWVLEANNFGPLIVAIDSKGKSMFADIDSKVKGNIDKAKKMLKLA
ncbi:MAG: FumA C-terminus/TtdB family hydratase beta subunit [Thermoplasmata archaeon]|nr:FumA C-terminus/TtdB family hydratase beta subunit [Thermoplasmata archaeon]